MKTPDNLEMWSTQEYGTNFGGRGWCIFVMSLEGALYANSHMQERGWFHSAFMGGKPVTAAGELWARNGKLYVMTDKSGHYKPGIQHLVDAARELNRQGPRHIVAADLGEAHARWIGPTSSTSQDLVHVGSDRHPERSPDGRWLPGVGPKGARPWQPGASANPGGKGGLYHEMLAREFTPEATKYLIEIAADKNEDSRNRIVAMSMLFDRAWGKPKEFDPNAERPATAIDLSRLTADQRQQLRELLQVVSNGSTKDDPQL